MAALAVERPKRVLTLWDLIVYGIVLIQPIAPVGIFGLALRMSNGHVATTILIAMVAMLFTALSYGRMASAYPSAGSAYTYVGRTFGAYPGFFVGWAMVLDYLIIPLINTIYGALALHRLAPEVPYAAWAGIFAVVMTLLNVRGVRVMSKASAILLAVMCVVIGAFLLMAVRYLFHAGGWGALVSVKPFYNPETFDIRVVMTATSLAALTYIGFDGVTTLAEEVKNPRRTIPLATVLVCLLTGVFSSIEVYLAQLAWPDWESFPHLETAFMDVTARVGGSILFQAIGAVLVVAALGSGLTGQAGAARLLYAMGRDGTLPRRFFGRFDSRRNSPTFNICFLGVVAWAGALAISYEFSAELLNFGAFLAFMGVNLAAARKYFFQPGESGGRRILLDAAAPGLGFVFCFGIWWNLPTPARIAGAVWFAAGLLHLAAQTHGFRRKPAMIDFSES
ncbi:MAG: APC family permease [Bryobacteraceae bacterium]|nr:APC family permease [Bryobacteraceae bacterium]